MKSLLKMAVLLGCFAPACVIAERGEPPQESTMEKYVKTLQEEYIEKWGKEKVGDHVSSYLKSNSSTIFSAAKAYAGSGKTNDMDSWDEWFDGSNYAEYNKLTSILEMLNKIQDCKGLPQPSGICIECLTIFPNFEPEYDYYLPVQLIEITDTPWKTGYAMPTEVEMRKKAAVQEKYGSGAQELEEILKSEQEMMQKEIKKYNFEGSEISPNYESLNKFVSDIYKRGQKGKFTFTTGQVAGGVYAFPHVFDTSFNEIVKPYFEEFWGHDGAVKAQRDKGNKCAIEPRKKRPVRPWFAEGVREFWYSSYALKKTAPISGDEKIKEITIEEGKKRTGRPHNYESAGNFSPNDILSELSKKKLEDEVGENCGTYDLEMEHEQTKCLKGQNGEKGPTVALVKDRYFTRASMIAAWRGLFWVTNIVDDDKTKDKSSRIDKDKKTDGSDFLYHPFFNRDYDGDNDLYKKSPRRPRSKMQVLSESVGGKYDGIVDGCKDFNDQEEFIPDWSGPKFGDANTPKKDSHNNQTVLVQWEYMKNCRKDFNLFFSPKGRNQYWF